jgi:protein-tyrosine phosphatase
VQLTYLPTQSNERAVTLEGAFNVRDLGGLPVGSRRRTRSGLVYRGDCLDWLTPGDREVLFGERGIGALIDLRTHAEAGGDGLIDARLFPTVRAQSIPLILDERMGLEPFPIGEPVKVAHHYLTYLDGVGGPAVQIVAALAESVGAEVPVLFHCAAGRDRTGVVAAMILMVLGLSDRAIAADYLESNRNADQVSQRLMRNPLYRRDGTPAGDGAKGDGARGDGARGDGARGDGARGDGARVDALAIRCFLSLVREKFGDARGWAQWAGVSPATVRILRERLIA